MMDLGDQKSKVHCFQDVVSFALAYYRDRELPKANTLRVSRESVEHVHVLTSCSTNVVLRAIRSLKWCPNICADMFVKSDVRPKEA